MPLEGRGARYRVDEYLLGEPVGICPDQWVIADESIQRIVASINANRVRFRPSAF